MNPLLIGRKSIRYASYLWPKTSECQRVNHAPCKCIDIMNNARAPSEGMHTYITTLPSKLNAGPSNHAVKRKDI